VTDGNPERQATGSWARQVYASLGKSTATENPETLATDSGANQF